MKERIMFAELVNGITTSMQEDPLVKIVSDTGLFLVTPKSNISNYPELNFEPADECSLEIYGINF